MITSLLSLSSHIFDFFSVTAEQNWTKLVRKQVLNVLYYVYVCWADWKTKMASQAFDWLRHFRLLCNRWTEFNETWQEASSQHPFLFVFFGRPENQDGCPCLWLAETYFTSLKLLNRIWQNLTGSKISKMATLSDISTKVEHCTQVHDRGPKLWAPCMG